MPPTPAEGVESSGCQHSRNRRLLRGQRGALAIASMGKGSVNSESNLMASTCLVSPIAQATAKNGKDSAVPFHSRRLLSCHHASLLGGSGYFLSIQGSLLSPPTPTPINGSFPLLGLLHQSFLIVCNYLDCKGQRNGIHFCSCVLEAGLNQWWDFPRRPCFSMCMPFKACTGGAVGWEMTQEQGTLLCLAVTRIQKHPPSGPTATLADLPVSMCCTQKRCA